MKKNVEYWFPGGEDMVIGGYCVMGTDFQFYEEKSSGDSWVLVRW